MYHAMKNGWFKRFCIGHSLGKKKTSPQSSPAAACLRWHCARAAAAPAAASLCGPALGPSLSPHRSLVPAARQPPATRAGMAPRAAACAHLSAPAQRRPSLHGPRPPLRTPAPRSSSTVACLRGTALGLPSRPRQPRCAAPRSGCRRAALIPCQPPLLACARRSAAACDASWHGAPRRRVLAYARRLATACDASWHSAARRRVVACARLSAPACDANCSTTHRCTLRGRRYKLQRRPLPHAPAPTSTTNALHRKRPPGLQPSTTISICGDDL
uniref:Uncharacterized protein n=1 Tax=Arundo donax TaxID=35708 RepID=A0A0A9B7G0_ARUDO